MTIKTFDFKYLKYLVKINIKNLLNFDFENNLFNKEYNVIINILEKIKLIEYILFRNVEIFKKLNLNGDIFFEFSNYIINKILFSSLLPEEKKYILEKTVLILFECFLKHYNINKFLYYKKYIIFLDMLKNILLIYPEFYIYIKLLFEKNFLEKDFLEYFYDKNQIADLMENEKLKTILINK